MKMRAVFSACLFCDKRFVSPDAAVNLRRHQKVCLKNPNRKTWVCEICDRSFPHYSGFSKHSKSRSHRARRESSRFRDAAGPEIPRPVVFLSRYDARDYPLLRGVPRNAFSVIYADPPFKYVKDTGQGVSENHYRTLDDGTLATLPVGSLATNDALLFMWCSGATMDHAISLCSAWGFRFTTVAFVWIKTGRDGEKPSSIGLGWYTRPASEFVILATRGRGATLVRERVEQVLMAPRAGHSTKPTEVAERIERLAGTSSRKIELFSRDRSKNGWCVWGDEVSE